jgi:3-mercaptopyruvate sulfurtransferase SseA
MRIERMALPALAILAAIGLAAQEGQKIPTDPATGRAAGAKEMSPEELRARIDAESKTLIIDVRDPEAFAKETIKGAVNIPMAQLGDRLKDIPRDTTLVFT